MEEASAEWVRGVLRMRKNSVKGALMKEHALLECAMVDAAFSDDEKLVIKVSKLLYDNMSYQAMLYGKMFEGFPEEEFKKLLGQHVGILAQQTGFLMGRAKRRAEECDHDLMGNAIALAALTSEWF